MKIVLSKVLQFPIFFDEVFNKKLPVRTLYKIFSAKKRTEEITLFYQEHLQKIVFESALLDDNGAPKENGEGGILIDPTLLEECLDRIKQLSELLVDFPEMYFDLSELEGIEMTLEALEAISPLIIK